MKEYLSAYAEFRHDYPGRSLAWWNIITVYTHLTSFDYIQYRCAPGTNLFFEGKRVYTLFASYPSDALNVLVDLVQFASENQFHCETTLFGRIRQVRCSFVNDLACTCKQA